MYITYFSRVCRVSLLINQTDVTNNSRLNNAAVQPRVYKLRLPDNYHGMHTLVVCYNSTELLFLLELAARTLIGNGETEHQGQAALYLVSCPR